MMALPEHEPPHFEIVRNSEPSYPAIRIDEDASEEDRLKIEHWDYLMHQRPAAFTYSLHRFLRKPSDKPYDEKWRELTDRHFSLQFWFDKDTEQEIADDPQIARLKNMHTQDTGLLIRARRLELYLKGIKKARSLGRTALQ